MSGYKGYNNYAFIDSQNVNLAIQSQGWKVDWAKFFVYLQDKYDVKKVFIFIGFVESNQGLYNFLSRTGYICIFKPTVEYKDGHIKGNCDAELVLQVMIEYWNFDKAVIITGDGDFYCLVKYLIEKKRLEVLLIPNKFKFSSLLKFWQIKPYVHFMNNLSEKLSYDKEKAP